jgi:hypothetical protein
LTTVLIARVQMKNSFRQGLFHPDDIKTVGLGHTPPGPLTAPSLSGFFSRATSDPKPTKPLLSLVTVGPQNGPASASTSRGSGSLSPAPGSVRRLAHSRSSSFAGTGGNVGIGGSVGRAEARRVLNETEFGKYAEDDDEDYEDVFGKPNGTSEWWFLYSLCSKLTRWLCSVGAACGIAADYAFVEQILGEFSSIGSVGGARLTMEQLGDDGSDEEDPFAEVCPTLLL